MRIQRVFCRRSSISSIQGCSRSRHHTHLISKNGYSISSYCQRQSRLFVRSHPSHFAVAIRSCAVLVACIWSAHIQCEYWSSTRKTQRRHNCIRKMKNNEWKRRTMNGNHVFDIRISTYRPLFINRWHFNSRFTVIRYIRIYVEIRSHSIQIDMFNV